MYFAQSVPSPPLFSSPTRRSSDLALASERGIIARVVHDIQVGSQAFTPLSRQGKAIGVMIVARTEVRPFQQSELDRSEEHTSELQSLRHLVCRLLLEKKKLF